MPYYRRRFNAFKKKKYYRRRFYGRKRYTKRIRPELKTYDDVQAVDTALTSAGDYTSIPQYIVKGTAYNERIGERIQLKSFQYRCAIAGDDQALEGTFIRFMVLIDKQPNTGDTTLSGILQDPDNINSPLHIGVGLRYRVLRDRQIFVDQDDPAKILKGYVKLRTKVQYLAGSAIPMTNNLIFLAWSNRSAETNPPVWNFYTRTRYTDE